MNVTNSHRRRRALLALAVIAGLVGLGASPAAAANGTLQGTVTSSALQVPLAGIEVRAYSAAYGVIYGTATTDANGAYSMSLPAGTYRLRFDDPTDHYERIYSGGSPTWIGSSTVSVPSGGVLVSDIGMHPTTGVRGTITDTAASPIAGAKVIALHPLFGYEVTSATTAADGTYELPLEPTTVRLRVTDPSLVHADVYSGGVGDWPSSSTFDVTTPGPDTFDATLPLNPIIHGTVTADGGGALAGIAVKALNAAGWPVGAATTAGDGTYALTATATGPLVMQFFDPTGTYATQYSGGSDTRAGATPVNAGGGSDSTVDIALPAAAHLTGTATIGSFGPGIPNVYVGIVDSASPELLAVVATAADGTWDSGPIPPGNHKVVYVDPSTIDSTPTDGYRLQFAPAIDVDSLGLANAYAAAPTFAATAGASTGTGDHPLVGYHCNPTTHFPGADLRSAYPMPGPSSPTNLKGCNLTGANLNFTWLIGMRLDYANLTDASLDHTRFTYVLDNSPSFILTANVKGMKLTGATMTAAIISTQSMLTTDPDWTGTDLRGFFPYAFNPWIYPLFSRGIEGAQAVLSATPLTPAASIPASGAPLQLDGTALDQALIDGLAGLTLTNWTCTGCQFGAMGPGGFVGGADLTGTSLPGANLAGANLLSANLTNANLTGVTGTPVGGSTATYSNTTCPNGEVTDGVTITNCVGRGLAA